MKRWDLARAFIETLPPLSCTPEVRPIENSALLGELSKVTGRPEFKQIFPDGTWTAGLVELAGIIPFQPSVDVEYALRQGEDLLDASDLLSALKLCFPSDKPTALAINVDQPQKAITVSGVNPALQVMGYHWGQQNAQGPFVVSLYIGAGPNIAQVSRYRGRYFLSNGYHRAYRLMKAGFSHIPCLIREANSIAETGALVPGFFSESVLMSARPPIFTDFSDDVLGVSVPIHAVKKVVRIRPDEFLMLG